MNAQEFWQSDFGDKYHKRNVNLVQNNYVMFSKIFAANNDIYPKSIIEFGAGTGQNLFALKQLFPFAKLTALEINEKACKELGRIHGLQVINKSLDYVTKKYDLVLTKGLLIHIPPRELNDAYDVLYKASEKYILICEYFNPTPVMIKYRGEDDKLWKRDFAGEMLLLYDLELVDYGFVYAKDEYPQDNLSWFLLKKK